MGIPRVPLFRCWWYWKFVSSCRLVKVGIMVPMAHENPAKWFPVLLVMALSCCTKEELPARVVVIVEDLLSENAAAILGYGVLLC